jgi:hypothetical protein
VLVLEGPKAILSKPALLVWRILFFFGIH